jgi:hypothetical protein
MTAVVIQIRQTPDRASMAWPLLGIGLGLLFSYLAAQASLILGGVIYALVFSAIAWSRPAFALLMTIAACPFQNELVSGSPVLFSIAELNLALTLPIIVIRNDFIRRRIKMGPVFIPVCIYLSVCLLSLIGGTDGGFASGIISMLQMMIYMIAAVAAFAAFAPSRHDYKLCLIGLLCVDLFLSACVISKGSGYVLGIHKNGVGGSLATGMIICLEMWLSAKGQARRLLLASMVVITSALILSLSRGAWCGAAVGVGYILWMRSHSALLLRAAVVLPLLITIIWLALPESARRRALDFDSGDKFGSVYARYVNIATARSYFWKNPVMGSGVGLRKGFDSTNQLWEALAETGVVGLAALICVHLSVLRLVHSMFRYVPRVGTERTVLIICGALYLSRLGHGMFDHYWSRGPLMATWASVGMAIRIYSDLSRNKSRKITT